MGRKKKKRSLGPRRKRIRRPARLASARTWLPTYHGQNIVRGYARWYAVDLLCAIKELRLLGVQVSEEYEARIRESMEQRALARRKRRAAAADAPSDPYGDDWPVEWRCEGDDGGHGEGDGEADAPADWEAPSLDSMTDPVPYMSDADPNRRVEYALLEDVLALDLSRTTNGRWATCCATSRSSADDCTSTRTTCAAGA